MPDARIVAAAIALHKAERDGKIRIEVSDRGPNGAIRVTSRSSGEVLWDTRTGFMASAERFRAVASARADRSPFRASPSSSRLTVSEMRSRIGQVLELGARRRLQPPPPTY